MTNPNPKGTLTSQRSDRTPGPARQIAKVYDVLAKNIGMPVTRDELIEKTGLQHQQVSQALHGLKTRKGLDLETVIHGEVYRLRSVRSVPEPEPVKAPSKRVFEEIGVTKQGVVIIQDDNGGLYRAEEL